MPHGAGPGASSAEDAAIERGLLRAVAQTVELRLVPVAFERKEAKLVGLGAHVAVAQGLADVKDGAHGRLDLEAHLAVELFLHSLLVAHVALAAGVGGGLQEPLLHRFVTGSAGPPQTRGARGGGEAPTRRT